MVQNVLIIGATSAVASEVARIYAQRGANLYLLARDPQRLEELVHSLGTQSPGCQLVGHESGDLNEMQENAGRIERAWTKLGSVDVVLIAHGYLGDQIRSEEDWPHAFEILQTNLISPVSLLLPIVNRLEAQGDGHLGVITSVAGERGRPRNYTYGGAKGGLTHYLQGVQSRLYGSGVQVLNIKLGPTDTPMTVDHEKTALFGDKQKVAQGIVKALGGRKSVVYLKWIWGPIMRIVRPMPEFLFQRFGFLSGR